MASVGNGNRAQSRGQAKQTSIQGIGRLLMQTAWNVTRLGAEVPTSGPVIVAANHLGWLDGPALLCATSRPMRVLAKHELWDGPFAPLLKAGGAIPIDWRNPDRRALHEARSALAGGEAVGIFPEGTRCRGDFAWLRDGISYLLTFEQVPVVPVAIFGTRPTGYDREHIARLRSPIHLVVGEPFFAARPTDDTTRRSTSRLIGVELRERLAQHVASAAAEHRLALPEDDVSRREDRLR